MSLYKRDRHPVIVGEVCGLQFSQKNVDALEYARTSTGDTDTQLDVLMRILSRVQEHLLYHADDLGYTEEAEAIELAREVLMVKDFLSAIWFPAQR